MAGLSQVNGVQSPCDPQNATLTVLFALDAVGDDSIPKPIVLTKRFYLGANGSLQKTSYSDATFFKAFSVHVDGIRPLAQLLRQIANDDDRNIAIIRGLTDEGMLKITRRTDKIFHEHPDGTDWVMLDIDSVPVPTEFTPYSIEAVTWLIENKLPIEFRDVTFYYQFSGSAGICNADGNLLKSGLCAHLFFFLDKRVQGKKLASYLRLQCMTSGFFSIDNNKGGVATLTHGIDPAPIRSAVQLHYISNPIIEKGVVCLLAEENRDGVIEGSRDSVQLPELPDNILLTANIEQSRRLTTWKVEKGYKKEMSQAHTENGIVTTTYYKPTIDGVIKTGRNLVSVKMGKWKSPDDVCTLVLDDENSPGSWCVLKGMPHLARRWDGATVPLLEFSESAYAYVRDELEWLVDVPYQACHLTDEGRLPEIDSFSTARHSLILAPTGSGKTFRMTEWMATKSSKTLVIYVAQTIPLVNQMAFDLAAKNIPYKHYDGFNYNDAPRREIFLTTNESLPKILGASGMTRYILVVDEFHRALDDFTKDDKRLKGFKAAITQAQRVVYMTGTLTDIQRSMLSELVAEILGRRLKEVDYCCYEFSSVKLNPLHIRDLHYFNSDIIDLFEGYAEFHRKGQPIPQTVLIMNTSKMESFNLMVRHFGLVGQVEIVSRPENTPDEIETARTTEKPILIASPLFSIGLNFNCEPAVLWCRFDKLDVDTSQINQTINRANRGDVKSSVRIYAGKDDDGTPFVFPPKGVVKENLSALIEDESEFSNTSYDMPMMLNRMAYNEYRNIERNTAKSLGVMKRDNAFQNYVVVELSDAPERDKKRHQQYIEFSRAASENYDNDVVELFDKITLNRHVMQLLDDAQQLAFERRNNFKSETPRTEREIENDELAIIMRICGLDQPTKARKVNITKLNVLFGVREPWLSDRLHSRGFRQSKKAAALKLKELVFLVETLGKLATGNNGISLSVKLNQDKKIQQGFLALATSERDYFAMERKFTTLEELRKEYRKKRSADSERKADSFVINLICILFEELGIFFEAEVEGRKKHWDLAKPIVPTSWDFPAMVNQLNLLAESLGSLPDNQPLEWGWNPCNYVYQKITTCNSCKGFYLGRCLRGNAVDFFEWGLENDWEIDSDWEQCRDFSSRRSN